MNFPRPHQIEDYIRVKAPFPGTNEITVCGGVSFNAYGDIDGTVISYSTPTQSNEFLILKRVVSFGNVEFKLPANFGEVNSKQHICIVVTSSGDSRQLHAYLNGASRYEQERLRPGISLESGGFFIIGQEQDSFMGSFERTQSYQGEVDRLSVWDRALSADEVAIVYNQCGCPDDAMFVATEDNLQLFGAATLKEYSCL